MSVGIGNTYEDRGTIQKTGFTVVSDVVSDLGDVSEGF